MKRAFLIAAWWVLVLIPLLGQEESVLTFNLASGDFDTGVAVSNAGSAAGTVTFKLFPPSGDATQSVSVTSQQLAGAGVGSGLDAQGRIPAGGTYTVLASELATAAGLTSYAGQIVIEAAFNEARAVNFVFNNALGSAHGYQAGPLQSRRGVVVHTFWGRSDCPAVEDFEVRRLLQGVTYAGAGSSGGGVGGFLCAPDVIEGEDIVSEGVLLRRVTTLQGGLRVDCAVCLMIAR
ncbi:MAG TPA: hypothetical protein VLV83_24405 [Acidobacteriota bacterium]|nr:hypothetical protein [Acidobacteriota bacterium]